MKPVLAWIFFIQLGLSTPSFNDDNSSSETKDESLRSTAIKARQNNQTEATPYVVQISETRNETLLNETRTWLEGLVQDKSKMYERKFLPVNVSDEELSKLWSDGKWEDEIHMYDQLTGWGGCLLDQAGFDKVKANTALIDAIGDYSGYRRVEMSPVPEDTNTSRILDARKVDWGDWTKQEPASQDLLSASQMRGHALSDVDDYVYEKKAGEGVVVYIIDSGVQVNVKDENGGNVFTGQFEDTFNILRTDRWITHTASQDRRNDYSSNGHGTKVASKVQSTWGIAKNATIIPVQTLSDSPDDLTFGFNEVYRDLRRRRAASAGSELKSVVLMSLGTDFKDSSGSNKGYTREQAEAKQLGVDFGKAMNAIFRLGVPIVLASGNEGDNGRTSIDHIPQVLEKDEFPVINVGSATLDGKAVSSSQGQGGTQLTIYAVGDKVDVHNQTDGEMTQDSGTSFAAAAVAGILAVHMNYQPWDQSKTGMDRVKEIKRWITTDESSFERTLNLNPPVNMIWNGADEDAHTKAGSSVAINQPQGQPQNQDMGRIFVVGMEQVETPHCTTFVPWTVNSTPATTCDGPHDFMTNYFFFTQEVDKICGDLENYTRDDKSSTTKDEKRFEEPSWPSGEGTFTFWGEQYTYKSTGDNAGKLWYGERGIECKGDLNNHDPQSDVYCEDTITSSDGRRMKRRRLLACKW